MSPLPTGTVTFLFTDIEGSTRLLQDLGDTGYGQALADHRRLLRNAFHTRNGHEVDTQGDGFLVAFHSARNAVAAALAAQQSLVAHCWPANQPIRVRMGLHTGEPTIAFGAYAGIDLHRSARICAAGHGGQILLSGVVKGLVEAHLPEGASVRDLGVHRLKDLQRPEHLFQLIHPDLRLDFPPLRSLDVRSNNLPSQLSSFIGREREIQEIKALLGRGRLVTLSGPGGVGKTRLALQVAAELLDEFDDGAWSVELAALRDPGLVPQTVAMTLGLQGSPDASPVRTLTNALRSRSTLLILDNCEHLISACAHLAETLLRGCPRLKITATSREPLAIPGELVYVVPPFATPDMTRLPPLAELPRYEAVRLFVERAALNRPEFALVEDNALAVAQACHRLDGIPLAIELAAARVKAVPVEQIVKRLDERFRLLTAGARTALPRHQTLQSTMDWSYELLSASESILFRRLAIFAGGFTLDAAEAICAGGDIREDAVLDLLAQLVSKSLVVVARTDREARYRLLETVRQYSQGKLDEVRETADMRQRHRSYFLRFAEDTEPKLRGPDQAAWLSRLEAEHDNLRSALAWSAEVDDRKSLLRLCGALWWFWYVRGYHREGRRWMEEALRGGNDAPATLRAKVLNGVGYLAADQADFSAALAYFDEGLAVYRTLEDKAGIAESLHGLGRVAWRQGDFERAAEFYHQALAFRQALGASFVVAWVLNSMVTLAMAKSELSEAESLLRESLAINRQIGNRRGVAVATGNLGTVALRLGNYAEAGPVLKEALALRWELGDKRGIVSELVELGLLLSAVRHSARAARLLGAAEAIGESIGAPLSLSERAVADYDRYIAMLAADLTPEAFKAAWAEGRAMSVEQALDYALKEPV